MWVAAEETEATPSPDMKVQEKNCNTMSYLDVGDKPQRLKLLAVVSNMQGICQLLQGRICTLQVTRLDALQPC